MEVSFSEVDLDTYQTTLEEVLTWLLSAEDTLHVQEEVSDDVEEVKEQFHTHEVRTICLCFKAVLYNYFILKYSTTID